MEVTERTAHLQPSCPWHLGPFAGEAIFKYVESLGILSNSGSYDALKFFKLWWEREAARLNRSGGWPADTTSLCWACKGPRELLATCSQPGWGRLGSWTCAQSSLLCLIPRDSILTNCFLSF